MTTDLPTSSPSSNRSRSQYRGRFAPSPTGPLHMGSLVAALGSWLDARAHGGRWLLRIEDLDPPREVPGAAQHIVQTLHACGLVPDEPVVWQSARQPLYADALRRLVSAGLAYECSCTRREIDEAAAARGLPPGVYAGTCRSGARNSRVERALRLRVPADEIAFDDRACGRCAQRLEQEVGDFVLKRADGLWAYQLAVVVDDAHQRITDVVRGGDLLDNTPRQIWLQRCLGLPTPRYLHLPVVTNAQGEKLSKQTGARALDAHDLPGELDRAWQHLGFAPLGARNLDGFYARAAELWQARWVAGDATLQSRA